MTTGHADHVGRNRTNWDRPRTEYAEWAPRAWASDEATWGIWRHVTNTWARRWPSEEIWRSRKRP